MRRALLTLGRVLRVLLLVVVVASNLAGRIVPPLLRASLWIALAAFSIPLAILAAILRSPRRS